MATDIVEFAPNLNIIYRELGQVEGRVKALEDTSKEIKSMLNAMAVQLTSIQNSLSNVIGRSEGSERASDKAINYTQFFINASIAAATALVTAHFSK